MAECGVDVGDAADGAAEAMGYGGTGTLACSPAGSLPAAEPEGVGELLDEGVQLGFGTVGPCPVVGGVGVVDLHLQMTNTGCTACPRTSR